MTNSDSEKAYAFVAAVRLAQAAPDLLAALKGLLTLYEASPYIPLNEVTARFDAARAAIAKAESR